MDTERLHFTLEPEDNARLAKLCGQLDEHLKFIARQLHVSISNRGFKFTVKGPRLTIEQAQKVIETLYSDTDKRDEITPVHIQLAIEDNIKPDNNKPDNNLTIKTKRITIKPRNQHQHDYIKGIEENTLTFGIGPAGTGKTYLAVACAAQALEQHKVDRIVLVRPAVEAGERLGFLPGDLTEKVDPYLRPIYDALHQTLGIDAVERYIERGVIEIAPLAFMRGRTLNQAFIVMDEGQNATTEQMKMFLTRIGFGSKTVVCGDITQIDLAKHIESGLTQCCKLLQNIEDIHFTHFTAADVVRHPLVQRIVMAYEKHEQQRNESQS